MPAHKKFRGRITAGGMLSSSSWVGMFTKLFLLAGLCVGGFYGWKEYQRRKIYSGGTSFGGVKTPFSAGGGKFGGMGSAGLVSGLGSGVLSSAGYNNSYDHKRF
ncbi:hypothetical protein FISHEDRAFT_75922 [Fistulina hepatica ATCC 64428]|uniref:Uncharacterized protein n=1 Tax=Fistulina hepatica ATCC 64428 TaxID=1128425 RepID=A0A0D7A5S4_9AGAR|nr:hypothetical protein FISHEDRAFT_75922 [Fistulina hepatica ATCC 64428]